MSTLSKKRTYTKVTPEQCVRLSHAGLNFSQIARELNCARNTVRKKIREYVKETGLNITVRTKPGLIDKDINIVIKLYEHGEYVSGIAEMFDVTSSCIYKTLKKYRG